MIAPTTSIGDRPHRVWLQNPTSTPDGAGGFTLAWADLTPPAMSAKIAPATAADLERIVHGTTASTITHTVAMPFHPGVTTKTRVLFNGRAFNCAGVSSPDERQQETIALCEEVVL